MWQTKSVARKHVVDSQYPQTPIYREKKHGLIFTYTAVGCRLLCIPLTFQQANKDIHM